MFSHLLPVIADESHVRKIDARVVVRIFERSDDRAEARLRRQAAHRIHRRIERVDALLHRRQHGRRGGATGVVRVEVDRQTDFLLELPDQFSRGSRFQQPGHVLDAEDMRAGRLQLLCQIDVIAQVVLRAHRVENIARVTDRGFGDLARLANRVDRDAHILDPVQTVEYTEYIHAGVGRLLHEKTHHVVGVVRIPDPVRGAQQHLLHQVGHRGRQVGEPLPGVLVEESHGHVERGATPGFHREQLRHQLRIVRRDSQHVRRTHAGRHERLVRIAEGRVRDQRNLARLHVLGDRFGTVRVENLAHAFGRGLQLDLRRGRLLQCLRHLAAGNLGIPVHHDLADVMQQLRTVAAVRFHIQQFRRFVDEAGVVITLDETRVRYECIQEREVRFDAAHPELAQPAEHAVRRLRLGNAGRRDLHEQAVVVTADDGAGVSRTGIEADAGPRRAAIGDDMAVVGDETVARILRRHAALDRRSAHPDVLLRGDARRIDVADPSARGNANLRLDQVEPGDLFGDRVLDLDARIDFDEIELARFHVLQELDGARIAVMDGPREPHGRGADLVALRFRQVRGGRPLHDLLVPPLHRAIAFEQVHDLAV